MVYRRLRIQNFKSIGDADLELRRINIFIGPPNTGKSNLLDALLILSGWSSTDLYRYLRFKSPIDLVFEQNRDLEILIGLDDTIIRGKFENWNLVFYYDSEQYYRIPVSGDITFSGSRQDIGVFRFWDEEYESLEAPPLKTPSGRNLLGVLLHDKDLRRHVGRILADFGLRLVLIESEKKIQIQWEREEDIAGSLDFRSLSDGLKRTILHMAAAVTNSDMLICFEEPEAHTFPYYTKLLAELIATDHKNQYIITTHNPYFIINLVEKTDIRDQAVYITYIKNRETKFHKLSEEETEELLDLEADIFFHIERFTK